MRWTPLVRAGIILGLGFGGFFDGIVLHQILQWHHMICFNPLCQAHSVEELKRMNVTDGFFHLAVYILTIIGTTMLFRAARDREQVWTGRVLAGSLLAGFGIFNFVEGLIDHQILGVHHVLPGPHQFVADMMFLASGVLLLLIGRGLIGPNGQRQENALPNAAPAIS